MHDGWMDVWIVVKKETRLISRHKYTCTCVYIHMYVYNICILSFLDSINDRLQRNCKRGQVSFIFVFIFSFAFMMSFQIRTMTLCSVLDGLKTVLRRKVQQLWHEDIKDWLSIVYHEMYWKWCHKFRCSAIEDKQVIGWQKKNNNNWRIRKHCVIDVQSH